MSDLAEFLAARLDEDEAYAKASKPLREAAMEMLGSDWPTGRLAGDRMLREVEAKRVILAEHDPEPWGESHPELLRCPGHGEWWETWPCVEVRALAVVYSDHPDYDETWRP